jgi:hypothetical protein
VRTPTPYHTVGYERFVDPRFWGGNVTNFAPEKPARRPRDGDAQGADPEPRQAITRISRKQRFALKVFRGTKKRYISG